MSPSAEKAQSQALSLSTARHQRGMGNPSRRRLGRRKSLASHPHLVHLREPCFWHMLGCTATRCSNSFCRLGVYCVSRWPCRWDYAGFYGMRLATVYWCNSAVRPWGYARTYSSSNSTEMLMSSSSIGIHNIVVDSRLRMLGSSESVKFELSVQGKGRVFR